VASDHRGRRRTASPPPGTKDGDPVLRRASMSLDDPRDRARAQGPLTISRPQGRTSCSSVNCASMSTSSCHWSGVSPLGNVSGSQGAKNLAS